MTNVSAWFGRLVVGAVLGVPLLREHVADLGELEQREARVAQHSAPRSSATALGAVTVTWMSPSFICGRNSVPRRGRRHIATPSTTKPMRRVVSG